LICYLTLWAFDQTFSVERFERTVRGSDSERAQMVFTDPPYNVPIAGHVGGSGQTKHREFAMASGEMSGDEDPLTVNSRRGYLIELDPVYVDRIVRRWEGYAKDDAILLTTGQAFAETETQRARGEAA